MDDEERRNAQAWIEYARKLEEDKQALIDTVRWMQNCAHEVYHIPNTYNASIGLNVTISNNTPDSPVRIPPSECGNAMCIHSQLVLRQHGQVHRTH